MARATCLPPQASPRPRACRSPPANRIFERLAPRHRIDLLRAIRWHDLDSGVDTHEQSECAKRRTVVCSGCDVVYSTNEEASTSRQSMAAERGARARARRGAGDQRRRQTTDGRLRHTHRRTFRGGLRACRSPPPPLSSLEAASGTFLSQLPRAIFFHRPIDSIDLSAGQEQVWARAARR